MARPKTPKETVQAIEELWASLSLNKPVPAQEVYDALVSTEWRRLVKEGKARPGQNGKMISLRQVQRIVADAKKNAPKVGPQPKPLVPWGEGWPDDPAAIAHLYAVLGLFQALGQPLVLTQDYASWILRLSEALGPSNTSGGFLIHAAVATEFTRRERMSGILGRKLPTNDLDAYIMCQGWVTPNPTYEQMVAEGLFPRWEPGALFWEMARAADPTLTREHFEEADQRSRQFMAELLAQKNNYKTEQESKLVAEIREVLREAVADVLMVLQGKKEAQNERTPRTAG